MIGWPQAHIGEDNHTERLVAAFVTALVAVVRALQRMTAAWPLISLPFTFCCCRFQGTELPLTLWNERYSTVAARDALVAARGARPPRSRKPTFSTSEVQLIDQIAARLLLEDFVEALLLLPDSAT